MLPHRKPHRIPFGFAELGRYDRFEDSVKLLFLGTGAGDFHLLDDLEDQSKHLVRARQLGGKNLRRASSAMISPDILIDFYDDRQLKTFGVNGDTIRHLLITHGHRDHFQPVTILEFAARLHHTLQIYGNGMVGDALEFAVTYEWKESIKRFCARRIEPNIDFHLVRPEECFEVGDTTVTPVDANHCINKQHMIREQRALNYVFERGGKTVFYGLDSSYILPLTLDYLRRFKVDLAVFDATFGDLEIDPASSGHQNFAMVEDTIAEFLQAGIISGDTTIVGSHISLRQVRPYEDIVEDVARRGVVLAYDGMVVEV